MSYLFIRLLFYPVYTHQVVLYPHVNLFADDGLLFVSILLVKPLTVACWDSLPKLFSTMNTLKLWQQGQPPQLPWMFGVSCPAVRCHQICHWPSLFPTPVFKCVITTMQPDQGQKIYCPDHNEKPYISNDCNYLLLVSWAQQEEGSKRLKAIFLTVLARNTASLWSLCEQVKMRHILQFPPLKAISISIQATSAAPSGSLPSA